MSRPIEFRAYHAATGRMFPVAGLTNERVYYASDSDETLLLFLPRWECELMQFTGITDRDEKQIFEGDILLNEFDCEWGQHQALPMNFFTAVVFRYGVFGNLSRPNVYGKHEEFDPILSPRGRTDQVSDYQANDYVIVGNVYQNPNLYRMGLFAPVDLRIPFRFNPQN